MTTKRRTFLKLGAYAAAAGSMPLVGAQTEAAKHTEDTETAPPDSAAKLAEDDALAQALGYKEQAEDVDTEAWPTYEPGHVCANCNIFPPGEDDWRPCPIFAGKLVFAEGWCSAWVAKA